MIFSRVSPRKGRHFILTVMVIPLLMVTILGVSSHMDTSLAASPPDRSGPVVIQGVGESTVYAEASHKQLSLRKREVLLDAQPLMDDAQAHPESLLLFDLFEDVVLSGILDSVTTPIPGVQNYSGRILDKSHGYFSISVDDTGRMLAQIEVREENIAYVIAEDLAIGVYQATEYPLEELRAADPCTPLPSPAPEDAETVSPGSDAGPASIDVLLAYTPAAEAWADTNRSGVSNVIAQAVKRANQAFVDSAVDLDLRIVSAVPVDYLESGDPVTDLCRATFSEAFDPDGLDPEQALEGLHAWRDIYGADLVVLMTAGNAGAAWLMKDPLGDARYGFSVTPVESADVSLVRHVGYNLGCNHSRLQQENPAPEEGGLYNFSTGARWAGTDGRNYASIMTRPENDIQVFVFSNPQVTVAGAPSGAYEGVGAPADNARSLRAAMHGVAAYREEKMDPEGEETSEGETSEQTVNENEETLSDNDLADKAVTAATMKADVTSWIHILGGAYDYAGDNPLGYDKFSPTGVFKLTDPATNKWITGPSGDFPFRMEHASIVDAQGLWLFGGVTNIPVNPVSHDIWLLKKDSNTWERQVNYATWDRRRGHTALSYGGHAWILGGYGYPGEIRDEERFYNDVWQNSVPNSMFNWTRMTDIGTGAAWLPRGYHTSVVLNNKLFVLGGVGEDTEGNLIRFNDVWYSEGDDIGRVWTDSNASGHWGPRFGHTSVVFAATPGDLRMWVIGGQINDDFTQKSSYTNDVWSSPDGKNWELVSSNPGFEVRRQHASVVYDNKIWVIGGWHRDGDTVVDLKDVWYSEDGITWEEAAPPATWSARRGLSAVVFPIEGGTGEGEAEGEGGGDDEGEGGTDGETEGETEDVPTVDFNAEGLVRDQEALVPLHDWVPLFRFAMTYDPENPAPRVLNRLVFKLVDDAKANSDDRVLDYIVAKDLDTSDLLEIGLFMDKCDDETEGGALDPDDELRFSWDSNGYDRGRLLTASEVVGSNLEYDITFDYNDPTYRISAGPTTDDCEGYTYFVAVRTSATWRSQLSLGAELLIAEMVDPTTGMMPLDDEGAPVDSYSPDFFNEDGPETLEAESFYSSSFTVYDPSGPDFSVLPVIVSDWLNAPSANFWQHTPHFTIPLAEFSRPMWNKPLQLLSIATGQFMDIRELLALDDWNPVVGINLHATTSYRGGIGEEDKSVLHEVNLVLTDVGGDPYGVPGNGGFNPKEALKPIFDEYSFDFDDTDYRFRYSGAWVWADSNGNQKFDPPTPQAGGGITFNGDFPLYPMIGDFMPSYSWEYIPEPPGGGDPWWKTCLRFTVGTDVPEAYLDAVPDNNSAFLDDEFWSGSELSYDYFVVTRVDSGHRDASLRNPTNAGATYGGDFRAFIEPRRFDINTNSWTGGIYTYSQVPDLDAGAPIGTWQNDPRWFDEPFWTERTLNAESAKPFRIGVEVHDMVLTYRSQTLRDISFYDLFTEVTSLTDLSPLLGFNLYPSFYGSGYSDRNFAFLPIGNTMPSNLGVWLDPFGFGMQRFQNGYYPEIYTFSPGGLAVSASLFGGPTSFLSSSWPDPQFAFETMPFYSPKLDAAPVGPRSGAYPIPPNAPIVPSYDTWPMQLEPGEYPRYSDWDPADARARLLTQKISANSKHTAMLGINLVGSVDPVVNEEGNSITLAEINIAFWGPDFTPDILAPLDPDDNQNLSLDSGVLLWDNASNEISTTLPFSFFNTEEFENYGDTPLPLSNDMVPVTGMKWGGAPELIDLSGDGLADDLDGDGFVNDRDKAWVLKVSPVSPWNLPLDDIPGTEAGGDDLYVTVKTSDSIRRFQKFRAVVPATLPSRPSGRQQAGIQFYPTVNTSSDAYLKAHGDEGPVQEYYGHDMMEANVPVKLMDLTQRWTNMHIGGAAAPVLGMDISTNRENGTCAQGASGSGSNKTFAVAGANWPPNGFIGDFLIDERFESYEIVGNTVNTLMLLSGTPRNGAWRIVREPTFLEEVTVELYQEGNAATFNPLTDLLPLDINQQVSGVAIYRDNDNHPGNRNGMFDPEIDIPLALDTAPEFIARNAENIKIRFMFSKPGTLNFPLPISEQPRNRQWVPDSFGGRVGDPDEGADFIVVLRASQQMDVGDTLRAGIVSWGPNTPTEPDPHIWAGLAGDARFDYLKFREFQWAERGLGFITYFKEPQIHYFLNGATGVQRPDTSGYAWLRSSCTEKRRSGVITARNRPVGPRTIEIASVSQSQLPVQTLPGVGFSFVIYGTNFGTDPMVALSGYNVTVNSATDTAIRITIETRDDVVPQEPVTLIIRNTQTGEEVSRSDLFTLTAGSTNAGPKISKVMPPSGRKDDFPVVVCGENFFDADSLVVHFGKTLMPIQEVSEDGTAITVTFPLGGLPTPGMLDVYVTSNGANSGQDVLINGFEYLNPESREKVSFFGCQPATDAPHGVAGDLVLMAILALVLVVSRRRGTV